MPTGAGRRSPSSPRGSWTSSSASACPIASTDGKQRRGEELVMFADTKAYSGFAVDDLERAREFYGETLGVRTSAVSEEGGLMSLDLAGDRSTLVYEKPDFT